MAQGIPKKHRKPTSSSASSSSSRKPSSAALGAKKGQRAIAPKKKNLVKQKGITKKYTAGLTGRTERALAEKAGHLEILGGGKRDKGGGGRVGKEGGKGKCGK